MSGITSPAALAAIDAAAARFNSRAYFLSTYADVIEMNQDYQRAMPFSGDALTVHFRHAAGIERAHGRIPADPSIWAEHNVWGSIARGGHRRMAAIGRTAVADDTRTFYARHDVSDATRGEYGFSSFVIA